MSSENCTSFCLGRNVLASNHFRLKKILTTNRMNKRSWGCCNKGYPFEIYILYSNLAKSHSPEYPPQLPNRFDSAVRRTNFPDDWKLSNKLWANETLRDLSLNAFRIGILYCNGFQCLTMKRVLPFQPLHRSRQVLWTHSHTMVLVDETLM